VWIASKSKSCFYKINWNVKLTEAHLTTVFSEPPPPSAGQLAVVYEKCLEPVTGVYRNRIAVDTEEREAQQKEEQKKKKKEEEQKKARSAAGSVLSASLTVLALVLALALVC
jgi:hypothetical protein